MGWFFPDPELTPERRQKIARVVARGKRSFLWRRGVLGYGVTVFLLTTAFDLWLRHGDNTLNAQYLAFSIPLRLVIWLVAGYWFGTVMWRRFNEWAEKPQ
jgi:hypothetical protein